jgi:hypothetical protein
MFKYENKQWPYEHYTYKSIDEGFNLGLEMGWLIKLG